MTNASTAPTDVRSERFGRYQLVRRIAVGGMAEIFLARQIGQGRFDKEVVIKRILPQYADHKDFVTMFLDEAALAARLNHPNIVQIFDVGREGQNYYLAMEYICGCDLQQLVKRSGKRGATPLALAVRIIADACAGLHYAHEMRGSDGSPLEIVHRDVSPQNVLISFDGAVKIADFGIAKAQSQIYKTRSGVLKGKYSYMSPEQALGQELDRRSDIFSLGILLYELGTGERLYQEASELMTLKSIVEGRVVPPRERDAAFPEALQQILLKALHKEPEERHATARELQADLEHFLVEAGLAGHHLALAEHLEQIFEGRRPVPGETTLTSSASSRLPDSDWSIQTLSGEHSSMADKVAALEEQRAAVPTEGALQETRSAPGTGNSSRPRSAVAPVRPPREPAPTTSEGPSADNKLKAAVAILVLLVVGLLMLLLLVLVAE